MFPRLTSHMRRPVKRHGAEQYLLLSLFSFAASVTVTRLFLALTGYPQIAGGDFHIAHALWGGLLLYIASLLPLIIANRWAYAAGAALAGIGVGLFIDEVGKFITQSNDYFYPLAAPIVYAFFLLTVVLYLRVRRPPVRSARTELFSALDALEEVLEQDLDPTEREALEARLQYVVEHGERPDLRQLAQDLLEFLRHEGLTLAPHRPGLMERSRRRWRAAEQHWLPRRRWRLLLILGLIVLGAVTLAKSSLAVMAIALANRAAVPGGLEPGTMLAAMYTLLVPAGLTPQQGMLRYTNLALESAVSVMLLASAILLGTGRERFGTNLGWAGLLLALTAVNLLVFYYDQFSSIISALAQLALLFGLAAYRQRYLPEPSSPPPPLAAPPPQP